ncbi:MAG: iron-containing alcohol dehydrogenase family protein [Actinobacteria bacterium]|nr:iron-containing alcohol dehydrogenase family protein [Actinomycetota bacterium]
MAEEIEVVVGDAADALAGVGSCTVVAGPTAAAAIRLDRLTPLRTITPGSLEELALDRLVESERRVDATTVVGVGGGVALDTAKYLALRTGKDLLLVPTTLASLAPFTTEVARRIRRQMTPVGDVAGRTVVDVDLLGGAPAARNRAGAAEVVATIPAVWDWRFADSRDRGLPVSTQVVDVAERCRRLLGEGAEEVAACTPAGLRLLADLLAALGTACSRSGHRRVVDGSEHTYVQSFEHRFGPHRSYGGLLGLGAVAMSTLQAWFGLSAGGPVDPAEAIDLLNRCRVEANPGQLGLDEGTFRGLLRHTVRFAVGEFLPYSVLNEADVNWSMSEEMWRHCWRVDRVEGV